MPWPTSPVWCVRRNWPVTRSRSSSSPPRPTPVYPPDHATHLSQVVGAARLEEIPGMGHALPPAVWLPLARAIEDHTARAAS